ncbi:hypothetical protein Catovirus_2_283 [Catovirus CTV1]|uniref:Uncharacterized protein n=1 Tax=Catovirus CTV1 TaxID=1977631 RepID=A0A1V0SCD9_9VIRU|nr:hypothetical protein Catovirus_2_283 [Catovirus CTV1]
MFKCHYFFEYNGFAKKVIQMANKKCVIFVD